MTDKNVNKIITNIRANIGFLALFHLILILAIPLEAFLFNTTYLLPLSYGIFFKVGSLLPILWAILPTKRQLEG